jgi:hypothetical protein
MTIVGRNGAMGTAQCLAAAVLGLALLGGGPSAAWAKACVDSMKTSGLTSKWDPSAKTTVKNETTGSSTILVEIYRGKTEKQHKYIKPGEDASFLAKLGGTGDNKGEFSVKLLREGLPSKTSSCDFIVRETASGGKLVWRVPKDATEVCPSQVDLSVACQIDFQKQKFRWHTIFTATDP